MPGVHAFPPIAEKTIELAQCPLLLLHLTKAESSLTNASDWSIEWW